MMFKYKYIYLFFIFIEYIFAKLVEKSFSDWDSLINYNPENKDNEYILYIEKAITADSIPNDFLNKYKTVTIKGRKKNTRIICPNSNDKEFTHIFGFSSEKEELNLTLENLYFSVCKLPQVVLEGPHVSVSLINDEFFQNNDSALQAISLNTVNIKNCKFSKSKKGSKPQIYIENKLGFSTMINMENCIGIENTNDIMDEDLSGGWGYFSNSEIHFKNILSDGNTSDYNGAVFNIKYCTGEIIDSEFKNSIFNGKGIIYQHYSVINIINTSFHDNFGYGCGIYYVYDKTTDTYENCEPSVIENCKFENNTSVDFKRAGAIYLDGDQAVKIYNSSFKNIKVESSGGCFYVNKNSYVLVDHCYFDTIYAFEAGGIFSSGFNTKVDIKNCYFKDIYANKGAIMFSTAGNRFLVEDSYIEESFSQTALFYMKEYNKKTYTIFNNITIANSIGTSGLLYLSENTDIDSDVTFKVTNSKFINNGHKVKYARFQSNSSGVGVSISAPMINISDVGNSTVTIEDCEFIENNVNIQTGIGGVLSLNSGRTKPLEFKNLKFINNTVEANGGGIYVGNLNSTDNIINIKFQNLFFQGNHAYGSGGGLYIDNIIPNEKDTSSSFILSNLNFNNNSADICGDGMAIRSATFKNYTFEDNFYQEYYEKGNSICNKFYNIDMEINNNLENTNDDNENNSNNNIVLKDSNKNNADENNNDDKEMDNLTTSSANNMKDRIKNIKFLYLIFILILYHYV